jgi:hypothetical protein
MHEIAAARYERARVDAVTAEANPLAAAPVRGIGP